MYAVNFGRTLSSLQLGEGAWFTERVFAHSESGALMFRDHHAYPQPRPGVSIYIRRTEAGFIVESPSCYKGHTTVIVA